MSTHTITGIVTDVKRAGKSRNGNSTYDVTLSVATEGYPGTVTLRTKADASLNYCIANAEYREAPHVFGVERTRLATIIGPYEEVPTSEHGPFVGTPMGEACAKCGKLRSHL